METHNAEITVTEDEYFLTLKLQDKILNIPITKDVPKDIQNIFNELIVTLKKGLLQFNMIDIEDGDIFYHVAKEYISHLNLELKDIYNEMKEQNLLQSEIGSISYNDADQGDAVCSQAE